MRNLRPNACANVLGTPRLVGYLTQEELMGITPTNDDPGALHDGHRADNSQQSLTTR